MDKFINTSNGGIPLVNDDFRWSDESIRDFIDNHLSDFAVTIGGNGNFYLSGVNISYSFPDYTITAGYVYIDGEIVKVDAQTCSPLSLLAGEEFRFEVVETYDVTGNKTTRNGSSIFTYNKRRAVPTIVTSTDPLTDSQLVFEVTASQERLQEKIDKLLGSVTYTEHNYIANGEKITDSIDALDVQLKIVSDNAILNTAVVNIGDWNMNVSGAGANQKAVTHGIADFKKIRSVIVMIRNDADTLYSPLGGLDITANAIAGGVTSTSATTLALGIPSGSKFDAATYSATSYNRGFVTIQYID